MTNVKVWNNNEWITINKEMKFFIGRCGSGRTVFGENANLFKINKNNLVFKTESGSLVKTEVDSLHTIGKAKKEGYFVSIGGRDYEDTSIIKNKISYWNDKKATFEYK